MWSDLPAASDPAPARRQWLPQLVPLILAAILWVVGWRTLAIVVALAAIVVATLSAVSPGFRHRLERVLAAVQRVVGVGLTWLLLGVVQLIVFAPASLVARLFRFDPLDPRAGRHRDTRWVKRSPHRDLPRRPFADERYRRDDGAPLRGTPRWFRGVLGGLVMLVAVDLAIGSALAHFDGSDDVTQPNTDTFDPVAQAALADQPFAQQTMNAQQRAGIGAREPFLGWRYEPDFVFESPYVNISEGARRTRQTAVDGSPVEVWTFGGSTMFGSGQRDDGTIASFLVELADADGVALDVTNYGHPAYTNWQQVLLLERLLTTRAAPDIVVFYDGFNDLNFQVSLGPHEEPTHLFFDLESEARNQAQEAFVGGGGDDARTGFVFSTLRSWWADHSAVGLAYRRVGSLFEDEPAIVTAAENSPATNEELDPDGTARTTVGLHRLGVDHTSALGRAYDFKPLFYWQPHLYSVERLTGEEQSLLGLSDFDREFWERMSLAARDSLADPVRDLSGALDGRTSPVFWDYVHTNEEGARLVANAIYPELREIIASS